jgi:hypothetical protein
MSFTFLKPSVKKSSEIPFEISDSFFDGILKFFFILFKEYSETVVTKSARLAEIEKKMRFLSRNERGNNFGKSMNKRSCIVTISLHVLNNGEMY